MANEPSAPAPAGAGETVFITGVPGFIGKRIASWALARAEEALLLVQARFRPQAEAFLEKERGAGRPGRATILEGDITQPGLGLAPDVLARLRERVTLAVHLAAAYDLRLAEEVGLRINVEGTRNVLDALDGAPRFKRLGYVSTCAISGTHRGVFGENDFDVGQQPKNHYEGTKFLAEKLVRERWAKLPTIIFRPTIVVGDSRTGEAEKIDGPYYGFVMIDRGMHKIAPKSSAFFHLVPVDFVAEGLTTILPRADAVGKVFHLGDPAPATFDQFFDIACAAFGKGRPWLRLPPWLLKPFFRIPGVGALTGVPRQSFEYTGVPVQYPCENTLRALEGTGVRCPAFASYAPKLVEYFRAHLIKEWTGGPRW